MIKIEKDLNTIPNSLQLPDENIDGLFQKSAITTHKRRMEVIESQMYYNTNTYNSRYKQSDVKNSLSQIYNNKCAFCENKVIQPHVEHYRPKHLYYWLAYSWDNLLFACSSCNLYKNTKFEIQGTQYIFENNDQNINNIHKSSVNIDLIELPKMVNPEVLDPKGYIEFELDGKIKSNDIRFNYTIHELGIDKKPLNDERRSILDQLRKHIKLALYNNSSIEKQKTALETIIANFISDANDVTCTFLAFRKFAIDNLWLSEIIKNENK